MDDVPRGTPAAVPPLDPVLFRFLPPRLAVDVYALPDTRVALAFSAGGWDALAAWAIRRDAPLVDAIREAGGGFPVLPLWGRHLRHAGRGARRATFAGAAWEFRRRRDGYCWRWSGPQDDGGCFTEVQRVTDPAGNPFPSFLEALRWIQTQARPPRWAY